jgi:hypothetical protein
MIIDKYPQLESHKNFESPEEEEARERERDVENENHLKVIIILFAVFVTTSRV